MWHILDAERGPLHGSHSEEAPAFGAAGCKHQMNLIWRRHADPPKSKTLDPKLVLKAEDEDSRETK